MSPLAEKIANLTPSRCQRLSQRVGARRPGAKRARRADGDYATSERDAERARRADGDYSTSERNAKRVRRADAYYATSEGDAKRARRADGDQKKCSNPVLLADSLSLPVNSVGKLRRLRSENLDCVVYSVAMAQY